MTIRPIGPADAPLLAAGFAELSEESRDRRFFTLKDELDDRQLAYLTNVDATTTRRWWPYSFPVPTLTGPRLRFIVTRLLTRLQSRIGGKHGMRLVGDRMRNQRCQA